MAFTAPGRFFSPPLEYEDLSHEEALEIIDGFFPSPELPPSHHLRRTPLPANDEVSELPPATEDEFADLMSDIAAMEGIETVDHFQAQPENTQINLESLEGNRPVVDTYIKATPPHRSDNTILSQTFALPTLHMETTTRVTPVGATSEGLAQPSSSNRSELQAEMRHEETDPSSPLRSAPAPVPFPLSRVKGANPKRAASSSPLATRQPMPKKPKIALEAVSPSSILPGDLAASTPPAQHTSSPDHGKFDFATNYKGVILTPDEVAERLRGQRDGRSSQQASSRQPTPSPSAQLRSASQDSPQALDLHLAAHGKRGKRGASPSPKQSHLELSDSFGPLPSEKGNTGRRSATMSVTSESRRTRSILSTAVDEPGMDSLPVSSNNIAEAATITQEKAVPRPKRKIVAESKDDDRAKSMPAVSVIDKSKASSNARSKGTQRAESSSEMNEFEALIPEGAPRPAPRNRRPMGSNELKDLMGADALTGLHATGDLQRMTRHQRNEFEAERAAAEAEKAAALPGASTKAAVKKRRQSTKK